MVKITPYKDHFIIGLTGNIGTGKSLVRKMLQHLGAYGIDADILTHEALKLNGPAQKQVIQSFGNSILDTHGAIDHGKLARIVFSHEKALVELENILHPLISIATENMIQHARLPIIIIEAIKLLESDLVDLCDSIWVVDAEKQVIFERLSDQRGMDRAEINKRLSLQSPSINKRQQADVVIENNREAYKTWQQVKEAWEQINKQKRRFSVCVNRASNLLAFSREFLITPSSQEFPTLEKLIYSENQPAKYFRWLKNKLNFSTTQKDHIWKDFTQLVCQHFLFSIPNSVNVENITIWGLSQFELTLLGHNSAYSNMAINDFIRVVALIEQFSNMHMVQKIIIPIESFLKERKSFLRKRGYQSVPFNNVNISYWNKAGYNLYQKKMHDTLNLFSRHT